MADAAVRVVIEGRVQGVWYRGWTADEAQRRDLRGWVRNRSDGTVEAVFAGASEDVAGMIRACRQGPPMARVDAITEHPAEAPPDPGFHTRPTA